MRLVPEADTFPRVTAADSHILPAVLAVIVLVALYAASFYGYSISESGWKREGSGWAWPIDERAATREYSEYGEEPRSAVSRQQRSGEASA